MVSYHHFVSDKAVVADFHSPICADNSTNERTIIADLHLAIRAEIKKSSVI